MPISKIAHIFNIHDFPKKTRPRLACGRGCTPSGARRGPSDEIRDSGERRIAGPSRGACTEVRTTHLRQRAASRTRLGARRRAAHMIREGLDQRAHARAAPKMRRLLRETFECHRTSSTTPERFRRGLNRPEAAHERHQRCDEPVMSAPSVDTTAKTRRLPYGGSSASGQAPKRPLILPIKPPSLPADASANSSAGTSSPAALAALIFSLATRLMARLASASMPAWPLEPM